jgi:site-specific recombinase XerD
VVGEGKKMRVLFLQPVTCQALNTYGKTVPNKPDDPVWWGRQGPLTYRGLYHLFKRLALRAGIDDGAISPHAWRHAFGRDATINGIPTAQLQDLMGYSSIDVTKIYTQFDTDELKEAHARYSPVGRGGSEMA